MSFPVGIGIITYNRKDILAKTIERVRRFTRCTDAVMLVADDGSTDGTHEMLRDIRAPVVTGRNMGIAWNKNRALFLLAELLRCEVVILLEDDTAPTTAEWEREWIAAARRWGHVNLAGPWMRDHFISGAGTLDDPVISAMLTAQCAAYSRTALTYGGYFDTRFTGYGHEHVEHSRRLLRAGYGGIESRVQDQEQVRYYLLNGNIAVMPSQSHAPHDGGEQNLRLAQELMCQQHYRAPWANEQQMAQLREEIDGAQPDNPYRFRLYPAIHPPFRGELD